MTGKKKEIWQIVGLSYNTIYVMVAGTWPQ